MKDIIVKNAREQIENFKNKIFKSPLAHKIRGICK